jgi:hypothetical protein
VYSSLRSKILTFVLIAMSLFSLVLVPQRLLGVYSASVGKIPTLSGDPSPHRASASSSDYSLGQARMIGRVDVAMLPVATERQGSLVVPGFTMQRSSTLPRSSSAPLAVASSSSSVAVLTQFEGINQQTGCRCFPPDPQVAAGPNYVVEMVNDLVSIYFKNNGTLFRSLPFSTFFLPGSAFSDPKVLYDASSGRWYASAIDFNHGVDFAVSTSNDPLVWSVYFIRDLTASLPDQPIIGVSDDKFVISVNDYDTNFVGAHYWIFNKSEMASGWPTIDYAGFGPFGTVASIHPVQSLSSTTTEYMVSTFAEDIPHSTTTELLFSVSGIPPGPVAVTNTTITVAQIIHPVGGGQLGSSRLVNTDDERVQDAVWYQGKLWSSSNDACTPSGDNQLRSCFRLTQIDTGSSTVLQDFDIGAVGQSYYYPALRVDGTGNLDVVYGYSSASDYPSIALTGHAAQDPPGSLTPAIVLKHGTAPDQTSPARYGDYFGAGVDPSNPSTVWVVGQYVSTTGGLWSTYIASMKMVSFSVSASPNYANVAAGSSASATITLTSTGGFSGNAVLTASISPSGPTVSVNPSAVSIPSGGSASSTLTVQTSTSTPSGVYNATVTATSGSLSFTTFMLVRVGPDFSMSPSPSNLAVKVASSGSFTVTLTSQNGFAGNLSLSVSSVPAGPTVSITPGSVSLSAGATATSTLTVRAPSQSASYLITVSATSGVVSHSTVVTFNSFDFGISTAGSITLQAGSTKSSMVTLSSLNGFTRNLTIILSVSPSGPAVSVSPSTVSIAPSRLGNATLTLATSAGLAAGNYSVIVSARGGGLPHWATVAVRILGYAVTGSQALAVPGGSSGATTITLSSVNGFTGNVSLAATVSPQATGLIISISPATINVKPGVPATSTITASSTSATPKGLYVLGVVGSSGPTVQTFPVTLAVTPITVTLNSVNDFTGVRVTTTGSLSIDSPSNTFTVSGASTVQAKNATTGSILFSKTYVVSKLALHDMSPGTVTWRYLLSIALNPSLSSNVALIASGNSSSSTVGVTRNLDINQDGLVDQPDVNILQGAFDCSIGQPCYDPRADINADGKVDIFDAATVAFHWMEVDFIPNYAISVSPMSLTLFPGGSGTATVTVTSINGFSGTVALGTVVSPSGVTVNLGSASLSLSVNGTASATVSVSSTGASPGFYSINVTGTSGVLSHSTILTVGVADFIITANPTELAFPAGPIQSTITITSLGGFQGTITLSTSVSPSTGLTASLNPTSVTLVAGGSSTSLLRVNPTAYGAWDVTITATSGALSHSVVVSVARCSFGCV